MCYDAVQLCCDNHAATIRCRSPKLENESTKIVLYLHVLMMPQSDEGKTIRVGGSSTQNLMPTSLFTNACIDVVVRSPMRGC